MVLSYLGYLVFSHSTNELSENIYRLTLMGKDQIDLEESSFGGTKLKVDLPLSMVMDDSTVMRLGLQLSDEVTEIFAIRDNDLMLECNYLQEDSDAVFTLYSDELVAFQSLWIKMVHSSYKMTGKQFLKVKNSLKEDVETYADLYRTVCIRKIISEYYYDLNQTRKYWSSVFVLLQLLGDFDQELEHTINESSLPLLVSFLTESNSKEYAGTIRAIVDNLSQGTFDDFDGLMVLAYLLEECPSYYPNATLKGTLQKAKSVAFHPKHKMIALLNLGYYEERMGNQEYAKQYYEEALLTFNCKCNPHYYTVLMYLLAVEESEEEYVQILKKIRRYKLCPQRTQLEVDFVLPLYVDIGRWSDNMDVVVGIILSSRASADLLYPGQSTLHLQDYYATNYASIFNTVADAETSDHKYDSIVVNTCYDTRARDVYRQVVQSGADGEDINTLNRINELLVELDNFHDYFPDKKDAYQELFELYLSQNVSTEPYVIDTITYSALQSKLGVRDETLVNIFKGSTDYLVYVMDADDFQQWTIPAAEIDSIAEINYGILSSKGEDPLLELPLSQLTSSVDKGNIVLIADGVFSNLPPQYVFGDREVDSYPNLRAYMEAEEVILADGDVQIYSYSSEESLQDQAVRTYPELPESIREVTGVASALADSEMNISTTNLDLSFGSCDIMHLSTHAYSSTSNRLDNFFLHRRAGEVQKVYGFNIYHEQQLPQVVVLSACQSGWGLHTYGAGVQTLSRAFLDNGTKSVIKTLWKVNEKTTADFMIQLYSNWSTGLSLGESLDRTQEYFQNHDTYSHPYYWAGFVLEGNPEVCFASPQ